MKTKFSKVRCAKSKVKHSGELSFFGRHFEFSNTVGNVRPRNQRVDAQVQAKVVGKSNVNTDSDDENINLDLLTYILHTSFN